MEWINLLDLGMFLVLLALFIYVFISSSGAPLNRIYLLLHLVFMTWPMLQFASRTTSLLEYKLFYLSGSYVGLSLVGFGWFILILFLTGQSNHIRKSRLFLFSLPALVSVVVVIWNPDAMFLTIDPQLEPKYQIQGGPLYWAMISQLLLYMGASFVIIIYKLSKIESFKYRAMVKTAMNGMFVLALFSLSDLFINVIYVRYVDYYIPLVSVGMTIAAFYIVYAIGRNKVFDIIQIVQRDVMNTLSVGIIVLDHQDMVIEVNRMIKSFIRLRQGDVFDAAELAAQFEPRVKKQLLSFFDIQCRRPLERLEFDLILDHGHLRHVIVQSAPIFNRKKVVGRVITFQNVTELKRLVEEMNVQNELLQIRNEELLVVQDELYQANQKLEQMAIMDGLTGCYNRRYLLQRLEDEVVHNIRSGVPFSIFIFDLDYFKSINDRYGHLVGDEVLFSTVQAVQSSLRETDVLARYGGEEFTVYLPHTDREQAYSIAETVKERVERNQVWTGVGEQSVSVTISMGVISIEQLEPNDLASPKALLRELMAQADAALYEAKYNGRNRIVKRKLA